MLAPLFDLANHRCGNAVLCAVFLWKNTHDQLPKDRTTSKGKLENVLLQTVCTGMVALRRARFRAVARERGAGAR